MNRIENILEEFDKKDYIFDGEIYIKAEKAERFATKCKEHHIPILGIDGLIINSSGILSPIDLITDFSHLESTNLNSWVENSYQASLKFLRFIGLKEDLYFCFVLADD